MGDMKLMLVVYISNHPNVHSIPDSVYVLSECNILHCHWILALNSV